MPKTIEVPDLPDHLKDWQPVVLNVPPEMLEWLQSDELGELIALDIGGQIIPDVGTRVLHLLDMSPYQRSRKPHVSDTDPDDIPV